MPFAAIRQFPRRLKVPVRLSLLRAICIAIVASYALACLWPFDLHPKNNAGWRQGSKSFRLGWQSIAYSEKELDLGGQHDPALEAGSISIEIWLRPRIRSDHEIHSILTLYDGTDPENLMIAEWQSALLMRTAVLNAQGERRYRETGLSAALPEGGRSLITVTSGRSGTVFYLEGNPVRSWPRLLMRPEILRGRIILGTSSRGKNWWSGEVFGLAILRTTLSPADVLRRYRLWTGGRSEELKAEEGLAALYFFNEGGGRRIWDHSPSGNSLLLPEYFEVFRKTVLHPPWNDDRISRSDLEDIVSNILGFIPFGFFYFIYRRGVGSGSWVREVLITGLAAAAISMAIELIQVYLPVRDSSLMDFICNVVGACAGMLPAAVIPRHWIGSRPAAS